VTLLNLVEAGILEPGEGVVTHFYHGNTDVADLSGRGEILWDGRVFESPSAFSIAVKRRVNPGRKADDGWKSVKVRGRLLEEYKKTYLLNVVAPSIKAGVRVPGTGGGLTAQRGAPKVAAGGRGRKTGPGAPADGGAGGARAPLSQEARDFAERAAEIARAETARPAKRARGGAGPPPVGAGDGTGAGAGEPGVGTAPPLAAPAGPRTEYAQRRPRRPVVRPKEWNSGMVDADGHCTVRAEAFSGAPGDEQPFACGTFSAALLVMDFHAHLSSEAEVVGLLGGTWDSERREMQVQAAFPVRELPGADAGAGEDGGGADGVDGGGDVEMDPEGEVEARETIRSAGLVCVGWYRSHPRFQPQPSIIDTRHQLNYQKLYEEAPSGLQPFVGAIVSPFDAEGTGGSPASQIRYFYVQCTDPGQAARLPIGGNPLEYGHATKEVAVAVSDAGDLAGVLESVKVLSERYCGLETRTDFEEPWRGGGGGGTEAGAGGGAGGGPDGGGGLPVGYGGGAGSGDGSLSALEKMMASLSERLPATWGKASKMGFLRGIKGIVSSAWMRSNAQARQAVVEKNLPKVMIKMQST